jgi:hypothetical protein
MPLQKISARFEGGITDTFFKSRNIAGKSKQLVSVHENTLKTLNLES